MAKDYPRRIGDLLGGAARGWGMAELVDSGRIGEIWFGVVGADIAAHVTPTSLRGGVLRVRAESAIWATEVGYLTEDIATRLNAKLGRAVVTEVRVWIAPGPIARPTKRASQPARAAVGGEVDKRPTPASAEDPQAAFESARAAWMRRRRMARSRRV